MITTAREENKRQIQNGRLIFCRKKNKTKRKESLLFLVYINGLFVLKVETVVVLLLLNDDGINGGGNDEPVVNVGLFEVVN